MKSWQRGKTYYEYFTKTPPRAPILRGKKFARRRRLKITGNAEIGMYSNPIS
jgi:hypothetical protein